MVLWMSIGVRTPTGIVHAMRASERVLKPTLLKVFSANNRRPDCTKHPRSVSRDLSGASKIGQ
jgi:hypothetical protein